MTVRVRLWGPSRVDRNPHAVVHIGCHMALYPRAEEGWEEAPDARAVEMMLPDRNIYWCSWRACFGPDNPRRIPWPRA